MRKIFKILTMITSLMMSACVSHQNITIDTVVTGANIQPKEALLIAEKHLDIHGTYLDNNIHNKILQTSIIKKGKNYYIKKTNYPLISIYSYAKFCIKVDSKTGHVTYID